LRVKNESILKEILIYSHNCPIVIVVENWKLSYKNVTFNFFQSSKWS
jgi:hypothetical protein